MQYMPVTAEKNKMLICFQSILTYLAGFEQFWKYVALEYADYAKKYAPHTCYMTRSLGEVHKQCELLFFGLICFFSILIYSNIF